ncbi:ABC transporter permease [Candidatus Kirkpatrickella diaphorinae]|uniref:ABC transporter permease n=1 Tax=Candidatus Kirkpatrickella diaphorinae TaxID=2984322 RepID=A0ABY6GIV3_9PROT|nr:ABC transporter permease [Candidatus Kirkpatrickella diaphorinae]UYH51440.1 ABC transporter permease [Candidatus Kirkpatrickella diaphorinae]
MREWIKHMPISVLLALTVLSVIIMGAVLAAPYARLNGMTPFESHIVDTTYRDGHRVSVMQRNNNSLHLGYTPIGPSWHAGPYALGADAQGRDVASRLLYGGRNSLMIASAAALLGLTLATFLSLWAGYAGGWVERIVSWIMTMLWAVPVYLFASCLSMTMLRDGLRLGPVTLTADNRLIPVCVIAAVYLPYAARLLTTRVRQLAQRDYVKIAASFGASPFRVVMREILPGLLLSLITFFPLLMALCLLAESALSFLSLGVQAPDVSWGSMIRDGEGLIYTRPVVAILPGMMIMLTVLSLYVVSESCTRVLRRRDTI